MPKIRKIPQRTCIGCRTVRPKRDLVRIVRAPNGEALLDLTGKKAGRGAYVCPKNDCLDRAFASNLFDRALAISLTLPAREELRRELTKIAHEQYLD